MKSLIRYDLRPTVYKEFIEPSLASVPPILTQRLRRWRFLAAQVKEAIQQHFDYATPTAQATADEPSTPRLLKRLKMTDCESEATSALQLR